MEEKTCSPDDAFDKWVGLLRTDFHNERYLHKERPELLAELFMQFLNNGVDMDTAKFYRKRAMEALTTDEGRKGKGKYKGWKEACFTDFDTILAHHYIDNLTTEQRSSITARVSGVDETVEDVVNPRPFKHIPHDDAINEWITNKYGANCTDEMVKEAHIVGSEFFYEFLEDTFVV